MVTEAKVDAVAKGTSAVQVMSGAAMDAALFGGDESDVLEEREALPSIEAFLDAPEPIPPAWVLESAIPELRGGTAGLAMRGASLRSGEERIQGLAAWSDEDFADVSASPRAALASLEQGHHAAATRPSPRPSHAEYAADALEMLARRVRAGDLILPGFDPTTGDAGTLVVALAALLGVRLESPDRT